MTIKAKNHQYSRWSDDQEKALIDLHGKEKREEIARILGKSDGSVRSKLARLGVNKRTMWTDSEIDLLRKHYDVAGNGGFLDLKSLAKELDRDKANVCRKAKQLGLSVSKNRSKVLEKKKKNKYDTKEQAIEATRKAAIQRIAMLGHPKGMLGKKHTKEALEKISKASIISNANRTEEMKIAFSIKAAQTKIANGTYAPQRMKTTCKAGWREIGGQRKFFRSRWEANYARYLQFLKEKNQIQDWKHEPKTFWFKDVKRGTVSYLPDFWVMENNNTDSFHEVKGWMDERSATKLKRMAKYYPEVKLVLIREKQYQEIKNKLSALIEGWE